MLLGIDPTSDKDAPSITRQCAPRNSGSIARMGIIKIIEIEKVGRKYNLSKSVVFHGGGWKQLENQSVDNIEFKNRISNISNISNIHNY